jgi:hypothetical protein
MVRQSGIHHRIKFPKVKSDGFLRNIGCGFFSIDGKLEPESSKFEHFLLFLESCQSLIGTLDEGLNGDRVRWLDGRGLKLAGKAFFALSGWFVAFRIGLLHDEAAVVFGREVALIGDVSEGGVRRGVLAFEVLEKLVVLGLVGRLENSE